MGLKALVVGSGVYVCGRGSLGHGTILPALFPLVEDKSIDSLCITVTGQQTLALLKEKIDSLNQFLGTQVNVEIEILKDKNLNQLLSRRKFDVAWVCTPDHTHFTITQALLENNIHTQVVKPLAPTYKECQELTQLQESKKLLGTVEFHKRFDRSNLQLFQSVRTGQLGDLVNIIVEYSQRKVVPQNHFKEWAHLSNPFQYLGVHYVDIVAWATKAQALRVMATGGRSYLKNTFDNVSACVEWKGENNQLFHSTFHTHWIDPEYTSAMSDQRIKVIGTKGRIECDQKDRGLFKVTDDHPLEHINPDFCRAYLNQAGNWTYDGYGIDSVRSQVFDVRDLIQGKTSWEKLNGLRASFRQSMPLAQIIEAANQSLENQGQWIELC